MGGIFPSSTSVPVHLGTGHHVQSDRPITIIALVDSTALALPPGIDTPGAADAWVDRVAPEAGTVLYCRAEPVGAAGRWRPTPALAFRDGRRA